MPLFYGLFIGYLINYDKAMKSYLNSLYGVYDGKKKSN